jgi:hypothetical protein
MRFQLNFFESGAKFKANGMVSSDLPLENVGSRLTRT